jgi:hypothetical protein
MEVCWPFRFTSGRTNFHQVLFSLTPAYRQSSPLPQRFSLGVNNEIEGNYLLSDFLTFHDMKRASPIWRGQTFHVFWNVFQVIFSLCCCLKTNPFCQYGVWMALFNLWKIRPILVKLGGKFTLKSYFEISSEKLSWLKPYRFWFKLWRCPFRISSGTNIILKFFVFLLTHQRKIPRQFLKFEQWWFIFHLCEFILRYFPIIRRKISELLAVCLHKPRKE